MPDENKKQLFIAKAAIMNIQGNVTVANPWSADDVDKLEAVGLDEYKEVIKACRFFYKRDPIGSSVINKMVDIGITSLDFTKAGLTNNEEKLVKALLKPLQEFAEAMTLEYLLTGLIVPEIKYTAITTDNLKKLGIKKFSTLVLPTTMSLRDPATIKINSVIPDMPSYYVTIPDKLIFFIMNNGTYPDNNKDPNLWHYLEVNYPEFIIQVKEGKKEFLLENKNIMRRRPLSDSPYPIPYLYSAIESMKHKRNIRRMDYSIASRVISAIQLIKMGSDEFPLTEDDESQLDDLRDQMYWRNTAGRDVEKVFQLFTNHTVNIEWVYPNIETLLNDAKYKDVNRDIFFALGFPAILITGETERSSSSDAEYAMLSPIRTMENIRERILKILNIVLLETFEYNHFKGETELRFLPINLNSFKYFVEALVKLYETANISRTSFAQAFGYNLDDEFELKKEEQEMIDSMGLEEFSPAPYSPQPDKNNGKKEEKITEE